MKFFFDNCLSQNLAEAIALLSKPHHKVTHLREMFDANVADPVWLTQLGGLGDWTIISGDVRISTSPQNKQAWHQSGLTAFFLAKRFTQLTGWEQAWRLVRWWPDIMEQAGRARTGSGFIVPVNYGKLQTI